MLLLLVKYLKKLTFLGSISVLFKILKAGKMMLVDQQMKLFNQTVNDLTTPKN